MVPYSSTRQFSTASITLRILHFSAFNYYIFNRIKKKGTKVLTLGAGR